VSFIATAIGTKVAIAAISLAALGGGTAVAAAAGVLPTPAQEFAHQTVGAPSPSGTDSPEATDPATPEPSTSASPVGPDATGPAAFGLCTAFTAGGLSTHSIAYGALVAASPNGDVAGYCAAVLVTAPGHSGDHGSSGHPAPQHTGAPSAPGQSEGGSSHGAAGTHGH
jgi:hypothetical protein